MKNAAADMGTAGQISDSFVSDQVDMICAIATPAAQSAYNAAMDSEIPVIYTAVTDPVAAELADEEGAPAGEVTGTSDKLPIEAQLQMNASDASRMRRSLESCIRPAKQILYLRLKSTKSCQETTGSSW